MSALFCWSVSIYYLFESIFCMRISIYYYVQYSALCVHYVQSIATTDNYLWVFSVWELYVQVKLAVCLRKDSGSPSEAHSHRFGFISIHFSSGKGRVVIGPDQPTCWCRTVAGTCALFQSGPGSDGQSAHPQSAHSHHDKYSPKTLS